MPNSIRYKYPKPTLSQIMWYSVRLSWSNPSLLSSKEGRKSIRKEAVITARYENIGLIKR